MTERAGDPLDLLAELLGRGKSLAFCARGGSMRPALRDGDVITLAPLARPPRRGEVVAARRGGLLAVHRVVALVPGGAVLRGDACAAEDGVFTHDELIGRAVSVRRGQVRLSAGRLGGAGGRALGLLRPLTSAVLRAVGVGRRISDKGSIQR